MLHGGIPPLIDTPTTTVQKRLTGRTMSSDFRLIPDLRYTDLFCFNTDYPGVKMADVEKNAEKAVALKMRWPPLPILCDKRDTDASFHRVRVHPDMSIILRTEFQATLMGIDDPGDTAILLYLALPYGWRSIPGYFPKMGECITTAHQGYAPNRPERDGSDHFDSQLFEEDAIFVEPDLGQRKEMAISCWEYICKSVVGMQSTMIR